ncbi:hypothetical protein GCM10009800_45810 [Nocardiopsis rhodophaea]
MSKQQTPASGPTLPGRGRSSKEIDMQQPSYARTRSASRVRPYIRALEHHRAIEAQRFRQFAGSIASPSMEA